MPALPPRRLTLFDLLVLVAAAGLAAAALPRYFPDFDWLTIPTSMRNGIEQEGLIRGFVAIGAEFAFVFVPAYAIFAAALVALRWRQPRPAGLRRVASQPGSLACLIIAASTLLTLVLSLLGSLARGRSIDPSMWHIVAAAALISNVGAAVAAGWITLALTGRWRPEPSWLDRAGCTLGALVIVGSGCYTVIIYLH